LSRLPRLRYDFERMLTENGTYIVPANQKWYRNYVIGTIVVDALKRLKMRYPQPDLANIVVE
jgi:hypothetical protein